MGSRTLNAWEGWGYQPMQEQNCEPIDHWNMREGWGYHHEQEQDCELIDHWNMREGWGYQNTQELITEPDEGGWDCIRLWKSSCTVKALLWKKVEQLWPAQLSNTTALACFQYRISHHILLVPSRGNLREHIAKGSSSRDLNTSHYNSTSLQPHLVSYQTSPIGCVINAISP